MPSEVIIAYLIDKYHLVISPIVAGQGPRFFDGFIGKLNAQWLEIKQLSSGVTIHHFAFLYEPCKQET